MLLQNSPSAREYATFLKVPSASPKALRRQSASLLSRLFLSYADEMMATGNARQLDQDDLLELDDDSRSAVAYAHFRRHYDQQGQSIVRTIVHGYGWTFLLCGLAWAFTTACLLFAPVVLHHVIDTFAAPEMDMASLGVWLAAFFASRLANALVTPHVDFQVQLMMFRMAVSLRALLFEKTMWRSIQSRSDDKAVDIANIYTSDIQRIIQCANQINALWILPIQIGVVVYMLYNVLGLAAFAGLVVIALSMLVAFFFTKKTNGSYKDLMNHKDERMKRVKEVFGAIQIVKFNAWEGKFEQKLLAVRELELSALSRFVYAMCGTIFVMWASPLFVSTVSFAVYTLVMDQVLTAAKVFTAIALFNSLRDPLRDFPSVIQQCLQSKISLDRMSNYLALHEVDPSNVSRDDQSVPTNVAALIEQGTFTWNADASPVLSDANLTVKKGDFVVVHGSVGSGKSSLCSALLGELEKIDGKVFVSGKVAYYSQQPWIQNMTKGNTFDASRTQYNMTVYALLGGGSALMVLARAVTVATAGLRASRDLFVRLTHGLLHAPLRFFDANPIGRIVNRFGGDITYVEIDIPFDIGSLLVSVFFTFCQLATAIYIVQILIVFIIPLGYLYIKFAKFYIMPSREISRLLKVASSPVLSHISQSEEGVTTIRAFGSDCVDQAIAENFWRNDVNARAWFCDFVVLTWFQLRMELIGCGVVMAVVSCLVYLHDFLSPGLVGVAFTYALSIDSRLARIVRIWSWLEIEMVSPERIMTYASIPPEGSQRPLVIQPDASWPRSSTLQFQDVVFNYKQGGEPVLKGLSFNIHNNEKIGIVGRTGAGKSSLTMALFRINELVSGRILIDGVDIATMPLRTLRSSLSIIPQSPVLFKGTLRAYMDPFDEFTDAEIWSALEKVDMKAQVSALEGQLTYELSENGENFSVGERQMLCMARALLTRSRIVVMDEATASIDHATEKKLQRMINEDFRDATVLTIAHRLGTVLDSDRIMVLNAGRVVEFDSPRELVKDGSGVFYELAKEGGYLDQLQ
ncbi:hypothetical protein PRIC2_010165 [Phytophthora ramorum]